MDRPSWDGREAWGRAEMSRALDRGLEPVPRMLLFEGEEATVYVRGSRMPAVGRDQRTAWSELFALGWTLQPEGALVVMPVRVRTDVGGGLAGEAAGEAGIGMEWMRRRADGPPQHGGIVLTYGLDDAGRPVWRDRDELPAGDGPLHAPLTAAVTGRWPAGSGDDDADGDARPADLGMSPAGLVYALRGFGLTVGVAMGWSSYYGFDVPIDPREVRREDRRRAEAWWDHRRELTEVPR